MKPWSVLGALLLAASLFVAGYLFGQRGGPDVRAIQDSAAVLDTAAHHLDSSLSSRRGNDSVRVAEPLEHAHALDHRAIVLGDSAAHLQARTDSALSAFNEASAQVEDLRNDLNQERAGRKTQFDTLTAAKDSLTVAFHAALAQLAFYRDTASMGLRLQRDAARDLLKEALQVRAKRCGFGLGAGPGYGVRGMDAGLYVGYVCRF